jgi:hypothetical protein
MEGSGQTSECNYSRCNVGVQWLVWLVAALALCFETPPSVPSPGGWCFNPSATVG